MERSRSSNIRSTLIKLLAGALLAALALYFANRIPAIRNHKIYNKLVYRFGFRLPPSSSSGSRVGAALVTNPSAAWALEKGNSVTKVAGGFTLPVAIAFADPPPQGESDPFFYVNEMPGSVKVVLKNGRVETFAENLLNFVPPDGSFSPQSGLMGICLDPLTKGLIATINYRADEGIQIFSRVLRLAPNAERTRCATVTTLLDTFPQITVASHTIQQPAIGPDQHIYIPIGDAETPSWAQDLTAYGGKILRMDLQGNPPADNPFRVSDEHIARNYVYAYGFRNPGVIQWSKRGQMFVTEVGPLVDRLVQVVKGMSHGWGPPATDNQMRLNALYSSPPELKEIPYGLLMHNGGPLGPHKDNMLLIALMGAPEMPGLAGGRQIIQAQLNDQGLIVKTPSVLLRSSANPAHSMHAPVSLAEGPDGVYFTDIFGDSTGGEGKNRDSVGKGIVWKVTWDGSTIADEKDFTLLIANWSQKTPLERGEALFDYYLCSSCHAQTYWANPIGPDLQSTALRARVMERIDSPQYAEELRGFLANTNEHSARFAAAYKEILESSEDARFRAWLSWRMRDPRFDQLDARMPRFGFNEEEISYLVKYLAERHPAVRDFAR